MIGPTGRPREGNRLWLVMRIGQGPRWWMPFVVGLILMVSGAIAIIAMALDLKAMHPPGQPGHTGSYFYAPPQLDEKVATWKAYWEPVDGGVHAGSSPLAILVLTLILDFAIFIPGYVLATVSLLGHKYKRTDSPRLHATIRSAALFILLVAVLDLTENFIILYLVGGYWSEPGRQTGPLDVALHWITGAKWTLVAAVVGVVVLLLGISFRGRRKPLDDARASPLR
jgi:hypothetical protein